jgi:PAS domain S-box-containing protein
MFMEKIPKTWSPDDFKKIIENTPLAMVFMDKNGDYQYVNPKFTEITGYKLSDIPHRQAWFEKAYPDPSYRKEVINNWLDDKEDEKSGEKKPRVYKITKKNGTTGFIRFIPLRLENGEYILTLEDITYRKMAEEALREREKYQRTIFSAIQTGIVVIDAEDNSIIDVNKVARDMIGLPEKEIIGQVCHEFICPAQKGKCPILDLNQQVDNSERVILDKNGAETPIIKNVVPVTLNGKECLLESFIDISSLKEAEQEIICTLNEKESLIKELNHRAKDNLMIISSLLDLQKDYVQDESVLGFFNENKDRARSMALIHEKLYNNPNLKRIDLKDYIENITQELYYHYIKEPQKVNLVLNTEDVNVDVNTAIPLGLIINELVSNSLKHAFSDENGK